MKADQPVNFQICFIGVGTLLIYLAYLAFYHESAYPFNPLIRQIFSWLSVILLLFFYWKGYHTLKSNVKQSVVAIICFAAIFSFIALLIRPFDSRDIYGYINRGWEQFHYNLNPYVTVINEIPNWQSDQMFTDHWVNNPSPYGFLFVLIAKFICQLGNGNLLATLMLFKVLNILAYGAIGWLIWKSAKRLKLERVDLALYLYLWNPLILLHHIANGHNDILMALFVMAGIYALTRYTVYSAQYSVIMIVAATLIKYAAAVILPFAFLFILKKEGWQKTVLAVLLGVIVILAVGFPYLGDWSQFRLNDIASNATVTTNSLHSVFYHIYKEMGKIFTLPFEKELFSDFLKTALWLGFIAILLKRMVKIARSHLFSTEIFIETALFTQFLLICVISAKFYPWYIGMFFPMAVIMPQGHWLRRLVIMISGFQLLAFTFIGKAHILNYLVMTVLPLVLVWSGRRVYSSPAGERLP